MQQDDILFSMQTVKETLLNAARLRLPKSISYSEKLERVNTIIAELGLTKAENTRVGDARHRGISGGERKRTNIAVEMIKDPSLLFLDEPTSGLDSFQALNVMETLKILCLSGVTVIVSVYQPRSSIYKLFDNVILLSEGEVAYSGPAGEYAVQYFSKLGLRCPEFFHPADYFLDIISSDNRSIGRMKKSEKRIKFILDTFREKQLQSNEQIEMNGSVDSLKIAYSRSGVTSGICEQISILGQRNFRQIFRDKFTLGMKCFMSCFFALFISALWADMGTTNQDIQNRNGILFFIAINQSFGAVAGTSQVLVQEKVIVMRERQANSYYLWIYYLSKLLTQLPLDVIVPIVFASIVYWIVGLNPDVVAFGIFVLLTVIVAIAAVGLGFLIGAMAPNIDAAQAMTPLLMVLMILFGGFYINAGSMPVWIAWLENVSIIKWCFEAYCINEYKGLEFCDDEFGCQSGEDVLELLNFNRYGVWVPTSILLGLFGAFHLIAYSCLRFSSVQYMRCEPPSKLMMTNGHENNGYGAAHNGMDLHIKSSSNKKKASNKSPLLKT